MRGRKPKSSVDRKLSGNAGKRQQPKEELPVLADIDEPLEYCSPPSSLPAIGKEKWREYMPKLQALGLLKETDFETLRLLCLAMWQIQTAQEVIETDGFTYATVSKHGSMIRERAEVGIMQRAMKDAQKLMEQLGMTSVSRVRTYATGLQSRQLNLFQGNSEVTPKHDDPVNFINNRTIN